MTPCNLNYAIYGITVLLLVVGMFSVMIGGKDDRFIDHLKKSELLWIHNSQERDRQLIAARVEIAILKQLQEKPKPAPRVRPPKFPKPKDVGRHDV